MVLAPATVATAAPSDPSEGLARILATDLPIGELAAVGRATSGSVSRPGPVTESISPAALAQLINLPNLIPVIELPLINSASAPGLLDLGGDAALGALRSYASSPSDIRSIASAGTITDSGGINAAAVRNPATIGSTKLELTALLDQLGVAGITDTVVDSLRVEIGALAAYAAQTAGSPVDRQYGLAGARLVIHSPAVDAIAGTLSSAFSDVEDTVNGIAGPGGALQGALNAFSLNLNLLVGRIQAGPATANLTVDLSSVVDTVLAEPLSGNGGTVLIDLSTGNISIDIAKLLKGPGATDLNGLAPNTEVLNSDTIEAIGAGIADALGGLGETVREAVDAALYGTVLTIAAPVRVTLPVVGTLNLTTTVTSSLGGLIGLPGSAAPVVSLPPQIPAGLAAPLGVALSQLITSVGGTVDTVLDAATATLEETVNTLVGTVTDALEPLLAQIASITINQQTEEDPTELENEASSATVRALSVRLLPFLPEGPITTLALGSATVRVGEAAVPAICDVPANFIVNGNGRQLNTYSTTGALVSSGLSSTILGDIAATPDGRLYGIALSGAAGNLLRIDPTSGATLATIRLSGPLSTLTGVNALSALPDGRLLAGRSTGQTLYAIDPATGVTSVYPRTLPAGQVSGGDFIQLSDGDVIAITAQGAINRLVRLHPDGTSTSIGRVSRELRWRGRERQDLSRWFHRAGLRPGARPPRSIRGEHRADHGVLDGIPELRRHVAAGGSALPTALAGGGALHGPRGLPGRHRHPGMAAERRGRAHVHRRRGQRRCHADGDHRRHRTYRDHRDAALRHGAGNPADRCGRRRREHDV